MGAPDVLQHLRGAGLLLTLIDGGGLHVAPREALTEEHRAAIRAECDALVLALRAEAQTTRRSGNPLLTVEQGDRCHAPAWDDTEICTFTTRVLTFVRRGVGPTNADDLAERLTLRDRERDDRRLCLECVRLDGRGRCMAASAGELSGADRRLEPVQTILVRCEGFELRKGLT
jgi:hypothetical protein